MPAAKFHQQPRKTQEELEQILRDTTQIRKQHPISVRSDITRRIELVCGGEDCGWTLVVASAWESVSLSKLHEASADHRHMVYVEHYA